MSSTPFFSSKESEKRWVDHIKASYTRDLGIHPCVFQVPQGLRCSNPEAYTPHEVGLGPYHHFSPGVQQMESQKRAAIKDHLKVIDFQKFIKFVDEMPKKFDPASSFLSPHTENSQKFEHTLRSFYDRYLDLDSETLAWIIIVDGIFLLHILNTWLIPNNQRYAPDVLMLENQIPLTLLEEIRKALKNSFSVATDIELKNEFRRLCVQFSPLALADRAELKDAAFDKHMLHFMYYLIVNNYKGPDDKNSEEESTQEVQGDPRGEPPVSCLSKIGTLVQKAASQTINVVKQGAEKVKYGIEKARSFGYQIPNNVEKVARFLQQLKKTSNLYDNEGHEKQILAEEIDVPSVSQLHQIARIQFAKVEGGIRNIWFDPDKNVLHLPLITLGPNSEVILRNLVAYEAAASATVRSTLLREYVDLMCGIIDSKSDVELLRNEGIILVQGNLQDEEIVRIFNGINKSAESPEKESIVQNIVQKVNAQFSNIGIVKVYKFMEKVYALMQSFIKQLFPLLVLMLLALQSYCEIHGCGSSSTGFAARNFSSRSESAFSFDPQANIMMPRKALRYTI